MICYRLLDAIDPKYNFIVYRDARDDVDDDFWGVTETEEEAQSMVEGETAQYESPEYTFHYEPIHRRN